MSSVSSPAVAFENVTKEFILSGSFAGGIKVFLFNFRKCLRELRHHRFTSLQEVSFEVARGECVGFIGRNGAGKSTTLALIAGVLRPTSGKVRVDGRVSPLLELGAGFHADLTGRENILLNGVLLGLRRREILARMGEIIDFAELGEFIDQPVRTYSSGMMARLGFSVVAQLDPEILLIDEVLAVGDASFQAKCLEKMSEFRRRGVTMVYVSHDMGTVGAICDRVFWIDGHRVRRSGAPAEVIPEYLAELRRSEVGGRKSDVGCR